MKNEYKYYVAYGININLRQMTRKCPSAKLVGVGELVNYKLTFRGKRKGVVNIEKCEGVNVPVVIWKITRKCEKALDCYKDINNLYLKKGVTVKYKNELFKAITYVLLDEYCNLPAKPSRYYLETIQQGYHEHGLITNILFDAVQNMQREIIINKINKEDNYEKKPSISSKLISLLD